MAVLDRSRGAQTLYAVQGPATSGKSTVLRQVYRQLAVAKTGLRPILISPPPRSVDAGCAVLLQIGEGLRHWGCIDGQFDTLTDSEKKWDAQVSVVQTWLEASRDVVLLIDEPETWEPGKPDDFPFVLRAHTAARLCLTATCPKVVTKRPGYAAWLDLKRPDQSWTLTVSCEPDAWLADEEVWGSLTASANVVRKTLGGEARRHSPLDLKLLVALHAVMGEIPQNPVRSEVSRSLSWALSESERWADVRECWARLALLRTPVSIQCVEMKCPERPKLTDLGRDIVFRCLLSQDCDEVSLHETLRTVTSQHSNWLRDARTAHGEWATALRRHRNQLEVAHHGIHSTTPIVFVGSLQFVEQMNALGRILSRDWKDYANAVEIFERALRWDPHDDYANHYLAYNLQQLGGERERIASCYWKAIQINPRHARWWSRYITFLLISGRAGEARQAWDQALEAIDLNGTVYSELHLWVALVALKRAQLEFADLVLRDVPEHVARQDLRLQATIRRLKALQEVESFGGVLPLPYMQSDWWRKGPFLPISPPKKGYRLARWLPGRLDAKEADRLIFRVANVEQPAPETPPPLARLTVDHNTFDSWSPVAASELEDGSFVEFFVFEATVRRTVRSQMRALVHPSAEFLDQGLRPVPDTEVFLRAWT